MNRREAIAQIALLAGGSLASRFAQAALRGTPLHVAPAQSVFTAEQRSMVERLAELIIPRTDTPGAIDAGVPAFMDQIVTNWYTPVERSIFMDGLASLDAFCVATYQKSFSAGDTEQRTDALTHADESSRTYQSKPDLKIREAPDEYSPFFYKLKLLTVLGYYTSEIGATQELSYNPVPGRYEGDYDFDKVGRQWSY
jgi:glucoside 3-dehydrogenase (cytochrome c) hitch-hiker subunit